jgi:hypothetical protein
MRASLPPLPGDGIVETAALASASMGERKDVIWAILAIVGVPLWLCAGAIVAMLLRNRSLRKRGGDIPMRLRSEPDKRWKRGHGLWVNNVMSFRASPAGWQESLIWVTQAVVRPATSTEKKKLHRLGDRPVVASLAMHAGGTVEAAVKAEDRQHLLGPYAEAASAD